jgi:hypothetical protein
MDKENVVRTYNGIALSLKKEGNSNIRCNVDGDMMLGEIN